MRSVELSGTTDAAGALTVTSGETVFGFVEKIEMVYDDGATGADLVFTSEGPVSTPLLTVTNAGVADLVWYPRTLANKIADASAFTDVFGKILVAGKFKVVVAQGGNAKNFRLIIYTSE